MIWSSSVSSEVDYLPLEWKLRITLRDFSMQRFFMDGVSGATYAIS